MPFEFKKCPIEGLYEVCPKVFGDSRGYFFEVYNKKEFEQAGLCMEFVQDNQSASTKGVLRGLHFQTLHPQGKLVRAVSGKVYDVAVDLRKNSKTFGKYHGIILDSEMQNQFYIPKGFAHGFYVLSDYAVFAYKCTDFYHPEDEGGIMWNDASIGINWNVEAGLTPNLSKKDTEHPPFFLDKDYFDINGNWIG